MVRILNPLRLFVMAAALFLAVLAAPASLAQNTTGFGSAQLDKFIEQKMQQARIHGLAVLVVRNNQVLWAKGYGYADFHNTTPVTPDTPFFLASISKTFTATAILQLWEQGKLGLDEDINHHLPFSIRNPAFPEVPITFRQLLSHHSSINRRDGQIPYTPGIDCPLTLQAFVQDYLVAGGSHYTGAFGGYPPGAGYQYSNIGYALLGYLVERVSGQTFEQYCQDHLFGPLGMVNTSWRKADFPGFSVAPADMLLYNLDTHDYDLRGFGGWGAYPAATLNTSANQLGKWLIAHMNGGLSQGVQILQPATVQLMQTAVFSDGVQYGYGLGMELPLKLEQAPELHIGHSGGFPGTATLLSYRPRTRVSIVMLSSGGTQADIPNVEFSIYSDLIPGGWSRANYLFIHNRLMDEGAVAP